MTRATSKRNTRMPLTDKTNVFKMKSAKKKGKDCVKVMRIAENKQKINGNNIESNKLLNAQTVSVVSGKSVKNTVKMSIVSPCNGDVIKGSDKPQNGSFINPLKNVDVTTKKINKGVNVKSIFSSKELFVKLIRLEDINHNRELLNRNAKKDLVTFDKPQNGYFINPFKNVNITTKEINKGVIVENIFLSKELFVKLIRLEDTNHNKELLNRNIKKDLKTTKETNIKIRDLKTRPQKVNFESNIKTGKEIHNLRQLKPTNYLEESVLDGSNDVQDGKHSKTDLKKEKELPIYKKMLSDEVKEKTENKDVYEFTDLSPKQITKKDRRHKSSIIFDKNIHDILKKLEDKEAKEKKKAVRKKNKLEKQQSYNKIVNKIVSDVMEKIRKENKNPMRSDNATQTPLHIRNADVIKNKPLDNKKVIHVNNFQEDMNVIVHKSPNVAANMENPSSSYINMISNKIDVPITTKDQVAVTTRKPLMNNKIQPNAKIFNVSDINPMLFHSTGCYDNSISENDIDSCFGFDTDSAPVASTPVNLKEKNTIHVLSNVVLRPGVADLELPVNFNDKPPNANSTMIRTVVPSKMSSPWRASLRNVRHNPHFIDVKSNALPRLDQEMVLNHTLAESFQAACPKTPKKQGETPLKKHTTQQSILNFVNSNIEKENEVLQLSLYDYEAFHSPKKKKTNIREQTLKVNLSVNNILFSTPNKRKPLADLSNSPEKAGQQQNAENVTYFGFDDSSHISPIKFSEQHKKNNQNYSEDNKENDASKPSRFNISNLRSYSKKTKKTNKHVSIDDANYQDKDVSVFEASSQDKIGEIHLFEEPEEMLDNMSPVCLNEKRPRRKRLHSCDSNMSDHENKRKKHKKTKLEVEQETWIQNFNEMCEEIDNYELELE